MFDLVLVCMFTLRSDYLLCEVARIQIGCDVCLCEIVKKRFGLYIVYLLLHVFVYDSLFL